jgi:hypothetical protein
MATKLWWIKMTRIFGSTARRSTVSESRNQQITKAAAGLIFLGCVVATAIPSPAQTAIEIAPCVIHLESLHYPPVALAAHVDGVVVVRLHIGTDGHVQSIEKLSGPVPLTFTAEANARKWIFKAGRPQSIELRYEFRIVSPIGKNKPLAEVQFDLPFRIEIVSPARPIIGN